MNCNISVYFLPNIRIRPVCFFKTIQVMQISNEITSWFVLFFKQYKSCSFPKRFWLDMPGIWLDITWYDRNLTWHDRKLGNINRTRETDSSNQFRDPWIGLFIYMILKTMGSMVRLFLVMLFFFFFFYFILKCLKILSYF